MKRTGFSWWELLLVVGVLALVAAIFWPVVQRVRENDGHRSSCQPELKQIALGIKQYLNDFDEHYPLVAVTNVSSTTYAPPYGWADAIQPYIRNAAVYQCPLGIDAGQEESGKSGFTDFWYNRRLAGVAEKQLAASTQTIVSGDGNDGTDMTDARYSLNALPPQWLSDEKSPAYRHLYGHLGGANYAFADGHVRWFKPEDINTSLPQPSGKVTFAIK